MELLPQGLFASVFLQCHEDAFRPFDQGHAVRYAVVEVDLCAHARFYVYRRYGADLQLER